MVYPYNGIQLNTKKEKTMEMNICRMFWKNLRTLSSERRKIQKTTYCIILFKEALEHIKFICSKRRQITGTVGLRGMKWLDGLRGYEGTFWCDINILQYNCVGGNMDVCMSKLNKLYT